MVESGLRDSEGVSNLEELELNAKLAETFLESDAESSSGGNSFLLLRNPLHFALSIITTLPFNPQWVGESESGPEENVGRKLTFLLQPIS